MRYEIQQFTLCDGWTNTWTVHNDDGTVEPKTFSSFQAAQAALDEFLAEILEEIEVGQLPADAGFERSEFRIVEEGVA